MAILTLPEFDVVDIQCPAIYGVVSHVKLVKLAFKINQHIDYKCEEIELFKSEDKSTSHAIYRISHLDSDLNYFLIKNKGDKGLLLNGMKTVDFVLCTDQPVILEEDDENHPLTQFLTGLIEISICFKIDGITDQEKLTFAQFL